MKEIVYDTYSQTPSVKETRANPYLIYRECEGGLSIRVVVKDEDVEKVLRALKGSLPDDVLNALGIDVSGEDLEELCEELRALGYECIIRRFESDGEYCEELEADLIPQGKYVTVYVRGRRVEAEESRETFKFLEMVVERGSVVSLRTTVEEEEFKKISGSREPIRDVLRLYGLEIDPRNFELTSFIANIESKYRNYYLEIDRRDERIEIYLEV